MPTIHNVNTEIFRKFKEPFGLLIRGSHSETMDKLRELVKTENPVKIISVGDVVSANLHAWGIIPQVSVTDNQCMRKKSPSLTFEQKKVVKVKNPQGTIAQEAIEAIKESLNSNRETHIVVEGEEDLLTLIAVLYAPENSLVIYGQPSQGIVVVKVTGRKRAEANKIWTAIKDDEKRD
jgi:GTP-dependent dephospho-CoA kinase